MFVVCSFELIPFFTHDQNTTFMKVFRIILLLKYLAQRTLFDYVIY